MPIDLGKIIPFSFKVTNTAGALVDPAGSTLTVTDPDGIPTVRATVSGGVGILNRDEPAVKAGLWRARIATTGPVSETEQTYYVEDTSSPPVVSVAETKALMKITASTDDELMRWHIDVATDIAEGFLGIALRRRTVTADLYNGGKTAIRLRSGPVLSVTTVKENGTTLVAADYTLDQNNGLLYRGGTTSSSTWSTGQQNLEVTYVVGPTANIIPARIRHGIMVVTRSLWASQRGGSGQPAQQGTSDLFPIPLTVSNRDGTGYWDYDRDNAAGFA
jgi:hypothetical protein